MQWFIENHAAKLPQARVSVLDVGSLDVNGSYKHLFAEPRYRYSGMDMEPGRNVDIVLRHPYDWDSLPTDSYDIVISGQAFEHIEFFWKTLEEMARVLKPDGLLCVIVPNGFGEHRYPVDCYRFFSDGMLALARYVCLEPLHADTNAAPKGLDARWCEDNLTDSMLVARKPYAGPARHPDFKSYACVPAVQEQFRSGFIPHKRRKGLRRILHKIKPK